MMMRRCCLILLLLTLAGCSSNPPGVATPLPFNYLPTAAAMTLAAQGIGAQATPDSQVTLQPSSIPVSATAIASITPTFTPAPSFTPFPTETSTATPTIDPVVLSTALAATARAGLPTSPVTPTFTPGPPFPQAPIQIYRLGEQSLVISPIEVNTFVTAPDARVARIELHGEDGRLLARYLRKSHGNESDPLVRMGISLDFEITAAAEAGRLVVSLEDAQGRLIDVNSVNLTLLSMGANQITPATALWQRLIIEEPQPRALIVGGKLFVSGRALPNDPSLPLRIQLIDDDGHILAQRLAGVQEILPGDYGRYTAQLDYTVTQLTPALLVVFEEGGQLSEIAHLSSVPVILAP
jgi:hypothetical protein